MQPVFRTIRIPCAVTLAMLLVVAGPAGALAQHEHMHDHDDVHPEQPIGNVDFQVDCNEAVRSNFDRALGLMHHMMYVQARRAFNDILATDPGCAMAHWGVATTLFQPLWATTPSAAEVTQARAAIARAAEGVESRRERLLVEATAAFFEPETQRLWDRMPGWIAGMGRAYEAYPDDHDVASLYGLALLTQATVADDRHALHNRAEAILRNVFEAESAHPGAIHYSIHATDADGRAANALDMVALYGEIAPDTAHALHMPSHIYVRLGDWPQVIDWNQRSAAAALREPANGTTSHHYIHAQDYLVYGHLQRGEVKAAESIWDTTRKHDPHQPTFISAFHLAAIPARLAVERRDWEAAAQIEPKSPDDVPWQDFPWPTAMSWFARGLGALHGGDMDTAERAQQRMAALREAAKDGPDARFAVYIEVDRRILAGRLAHAKGEHDEAVAHLRKAAELEASVEKHPVTPGALLPPNEALGELLAELERPQEALDAYRASDAIWPGRYNTLLGAARAAEAAGHTQEAEQFYARLAAIAGEGERD
ncbi:MAG: hypothetical protein JJU27_07395 [Gammaproteobacteria bacterium]|nr:hypothetical protein [Gammaproteobacteria bacterium]